MPAYGKLQLADAKRAGFHGIFIPARLNRSSLANLCCKLRSREISVPNIPHGPVDPVGFAGHPWTLQLTQMQQKLLNTIGQSLIGIGLYTVAFESLVLLIRPCEVLSRVANVTILEVANNALRVLLQHRHVIIGSLA